MGVRVDANWSYRGYRAVVLENEKLRVTILPELGAKVWEFVYKPKDRNLLWHHPRIEPRAVPVGASYDDNWSGGWDELFPNDAPLTYKGETYPDHGELWCQPWEWDAEATGDQAAVYLRRDGAITPVRAEKRLVLRSGEAKLDFHHTFTNLGGGDVDFLWKLHPALRVDADSRIDLPAGEIIAEPEFCSRFDPALSSFAWPFARGARGEEIDLRRVPPKSARAVDFYYGDGLSAGWCALTHTAERFGFGLAFPKEILSTVWVFASYGGWRDLYTVVLEPCTGYPYRLDEAVRRGRFSRLGPGETLEAAVTAVAYEGFASVTAIRPGGEVEGTSQ